MNIRFWTSTVKSLLVTSCSDSIYNILQHYPPLNLTGECYFVQHFCWRREYGVSQKQLFEILEALTVCDLVNGPGKHFNSSLSI